MTHAQTYLMSEEDMKTAHMVELQVNPVFADAASTFMSECISNGMNPKVASAALTFLLCCNLARIAAAASKLPRGLIDKHESELEAIASQCQQLMANGVAALIARLSVQRDASN